MTTKESSQEAVKATIMAAITPTMTWKVVPNRNPVAFEEEKSTNQHTCKILYASYVYATYATVYTSTVKSIF